MEREKAIEVVRRKLWASGYRVKSAREVFDNPSYDLVVEGKYTVLVLPFAENMCMVEVECTTVAIVHKKGKMVEYTSPEGPTPLARKVFGLSATMHKRHVESKNGKEKVGEEAAKESKKGKGSKAKVAKR